MMQLVHTNRNIIYDIDDLNGPVYNKCIRSD